MGTLEALSLAMGTAWTSGINLYATVAALGIANRLELIHLPQSLDVLSHPGVIAIACIMYVIEFFADKVPYLDTGWGLRASRSQPADPARATPTTGFRIAIDHDGRSP